MTAPNPNPTAISNTGNPTATPIICGIVRLKPKLTPDAATIKLFGPGVMDMTAANGRSERKIDGDIVLPSSVTKRASILR